MGHYRSNLRDIEFNLFEVFHAEKNMGVAPFEQMDADTARSILTEVENLASNDLADSYAEADRNPPVFDPEHHTAVLPQALKKSYQRLIDGEWYRLSLSPDLGGYGAPPSLNWACGEMLAGSNAAAYIYMACGTFPEILYRLGTPEQKKLAQQAVDNLWGATMVLTEPDAGSDVGAGTTKATEQPDGSWRIDGVKRFITSGEHDLADNILHFVLARPVGAGPGTKGLSMFIVPKFHVKENGTLG
jgi:alkylation response protein AidB-like acyl-CoA dehydrogenase